MCLGPFLRNLRLSPSAEVSRPVLRNLWLQQNDFAKELGQYFYDIATMAKLALRDRLLGTGSCG